MRIAAWSLTMLLLSAGLTSCRMAEQPGPGPGPDEGVQMPRTLSAYTAELRKAKDFCEQWGLMEDFVRCKRELQRVEEQGVMPDEIHPVIKSILETQRSQTEE